MRASAFDRAVICQLAQLIVSFVCLLIERITKGRWHSGPRARRFWNAVLPGEMSRNVALQLSAVKIVQ